MGAGKISALQLSNFPFERSCSHIKNKNKNFKGKAYESPIRYKGSKVACSRVSPVT